MITVLRRPVLAAFAAGCVAAVVASGGQAASSPLRVIAVDIGPGTSSSDIDLSRPGKLDVGDGFTETNVLLANGRRIGRLELTCTILRIVGGNPVNFHCSGLFFLPAGRVAIFGPLNGPRSTLAVVGGTGRYSGVRGEVRMRPLTEHRTEWLLKLIA